MCTHLCGTFTQFYHLKQGHVFHPILLMMAIQPAKTSDPPCSPTFGLVSEPLLAFPGWLLWRKMENGRSSFEFNFFFCHRNVDMSVS